MIKEQRRVRAYGVALGLAGRYVYYTTTTFACESASSLVQLVQPTTTVSRSLGAGNTARASVVPLRAF